MPKVTSNSTCIICTKKTIPPKGNFQEQLTVVFFMKRFFTYSVLQDENKEKYLQSLLQKNGNPTNWIWFCTSCLERVEKAQKAFALSEKLEFTLESLRDGIERKVLQSSRYSSRMSPTSVRNEELFKIVRDSINAHQNTSSTTESVDCDFKTESAEEEDFDLDACINTFENIGTVADDDNRLEYPIKIEASNLLVDRRKRKRSVSKNTSVLRHSSSSVSVNKRITSTKPEKIEYNKNEVPEELRTCTVCFQVFETPALVSKHYISKHAKASTVINFEENKLSTGCSDLSKNEKDYINVGKFMKVDISVKNETGMSDSEPEGEDCNFDDEPTSPYEETNADQVTNGDGADENKKKRRSTRQLTRTYKTETTEDNESDGFDVKSDDDEFNPQFSDNSSSNELDADINDTNSESEHEHSSKSQTLKRKSRLKDHKAHRRRGRTDEERERQRLYSRMWREKEKLKNDPIDPKKVAKRTCPICNKILATYSLMKRHVEGYHNKSRTCVCELCGKSFSAKEGLTKHMKFHENGDIAIKSFKCTYEGCGKEYVEKVSLMNHERTHKEVKDFFCTICATSFVCKSSLERHNQAKHSEGDSEKFVCDVCGKVFAYKHGLVKHLKRGTHRGRGRVKTDRSQVKIEGEKFECHVCGQVFKMKDYLRRHLKKGTHTKKGRPTESATKQKSFEGWRSQNHYFA